jgi:hypothetical protein
MAAPTVRTFVYPHEGYWEAVQRMANRMGFSDQKYGSIESGYPTPGNAMRALQERIDLYLKTGNIEWLYDAANYCIIESVLPSHPDAHFRATDSDESPGVPGLLDRHDG